MKNKEEFDKQILPRVREYLENETDAEFRDEVAVLYAHNNMDALNERFYQTLEFGTGGIRGIIGGGYNRINTLVVRQVTQGLAAYLKKTAGPKVKMVIAHDSRRCSGKFTREAALVLAANGITTFLFPQLTPTPMLSFMVRHLNADAGIVITASHNPPDYNGYKVYWNDGAQILSPHDHNIIEEIKRVGNHIMTATEEEAQKKGLLVMIDPAEEAPYFAMIKRRLTAWDSLVGSAKDLHVVYTPLHGTGLVPVTRIFDELGVRFTVVPEQRAPDPSFTNAPNPNPENPAAFNFAFQLAKETHTDLIIATDPDADRIGLAIPENGAYRLLTGNETGTLFLHHILSTRRAAVSSGRIPYVVKTIVTSQLQNRIAGDFGVACIDTLTGFKYICGVMRRMEQEQPESEFLYANEESCGYLIETEVRDKDGVSAAALAVEMTLFCKRQGMTLAEKLKTIYQHYGFYQESQLSKNFPGAGGMDVITGIMRELRDEPKKLFGDLGVTEIKDYLSGESKNPETGAAEKNLDLPSSDVLQFFLDDASVITVRPSGTETKIKFYFSLHKEPPFAYEPAEKELKEKNGRFHGMVRDYLEGRG